MVLMLQRKHPEYTQCHVRCYKKMQCTIFKMIALIDALKKYFQNALDKILSTD
jgi:hypothetical protein